MLNKAGSTHQFGFFWTQCKVILVTTFIETLKCDSDDNMLTHRRIMVQYFTPYISLTLQLNEPGTSETAEGVLQCF